MSDLYRHIGNHAWDDSVAHEGGDCWVKVEPVTKFRQPYEQGAWYPIGNRGGITLPKGTYAIVAVDDEM